jgi:HK97 family phage major capsid protein
MDKIPLSRALPIYLAAVVMAIAGAPLNVYDFHTRGHGTETVEPWRRTLSAGVTRAVTALRAIGQFLWPYRQRVALACALLVFLALAPPSLHAHGVAIGVVAGQLNVAQLDSDLKAKQAAAKTLLETTMRACQDTVVKAATATEPELKGRVMTKEEKAAIQVILDEGKAIKARLDDAEADTRLMAEINKLTREQRPSDGARPTATALKSMGQQLIDDPAFRAFITKQGHRGSSAWISPMVELHATTLDTSAGSGGPLIVTEYQPGITPLLFKRLTVADLIAPGTTDSNSITYMKETTFTNAAAAVLEGGTKPESTLVFAQVVDPVNKIAHWLPVTEEMLEDFSATQSYVDARLRLGLALAEEDQLLNGNGTAPNIRGILQRVGLTAAQARGADTNADAIFKQVTTISSTVFVQPDGIVLNPTNWQTIQLTKNAAGNYLGSGPWANAQPAQLWGYPVAVTPSIVLNTGLVGAFRECAQFFRKGGVRVEASNSHMDFFVKNLVAIRCEERGALAVYRPAAFGTVTGLN